MKIDTNFIIDVGVGKSVEQWLTDEGYKVISIRSLNAEMEDGQIVSLALTEDAIIITMDKDFGELVYKEKKQHKGILLLRLDDAVANEKLAVVQSLFPSELENIKNHFTVYQNGKLRIRPQSL
jgi:predicted nuclease of predicted toxin-antitoxin system